MIDPPSLPAPYEPVHLEQVDSVRDELARRAEAGADEGLLLWADRQSAPLARLGRSWQSTPGDLACGVLLRPDFGREEAGQVSLVASLALGQALAELAPVMTALHYRWPNDVLLAGGKAGAIWLDAPPAGEPLDWLGISFAVNIEGAPQDTAGFATSLREQQAEEVDANRVLEQLSRYLLAGLNRWAADGLAPMLRGWRSRHLDTGDELLIALPSETLRGRPVAIEDDGSLNLATGGGERRITPAVFHGIIAS